MKQPQGHWMRIFQQMTSIWPRFSQCQGCQQPRGSHTCLHPTAVTCAQHPRSGKIKHIHNTLTDSHPTHRIHRLYKSRVIIISILTFFGLQFDFCFVNFAYIPAAVISTLPRSRPSWILDEPGLSCTRHRRGPRDPAAFEERWLLQQPTAPPARAMAPRQLCRGAFH